MPGAADEQVVLKGDLSDEVVVGYLSDGILMGVVGIGMLRVVSGYRAQIGKPLS